MKIEGEKKRKLNCWNIGKQNFIKGLFCVLLFMLIYLFKMDRNVSLYVIIPSSINVTNKQNNVVSIVYIRCVLTKIEV